MTIKEFIERAIEGGWKPEGKKIDGFHQGDSGAWMFWKNARIYQSHMRTQEVLLDHLAWKAVFKECNCTAKVCTIPNFRDYMHRFVEALCDDKPLETALAEATSN